jgi:hypothetical protein
MQETSFFSLGAYTGKKEIRQDVLKICGYYEDDYNIIDADTEIQNYLKKHSSEYGKYVDETKSIVQQYHQLYYKPAVIIFGKPQKPETKLCNEKMEHRHKLIENFLEIAKKFVNIEMKREYKYEDNCPCCGDSMEDLYTDENGIQLCVQCGYERIQLSSTSSSKVVVKAISKSDYEERKNFMTALHKYECKQMTRFSKKLYKDLDNYFSKEGLPIGDEIKKLPLNERGMRGKTSRNMLLNALSATGYSEFYVDCSLIGHLYFGWDAPNVEHLEDRIMQDYDDTQKIFNSLHLNGRSSSLNIQYRLFKHLQLVGHPCVAEDFNIVKTLDILENLEILWKQMVTEAGLPYYPTI